ncbi:Trk system potassium transport protein TrkA [Propionigenium maris DSM 9537]|uniref:Trk system potassium uptake protein TrkA n=1 Tax=Propionigenium maris DSM 9537 TaxID=1123000 RepID=A0A9W6LLW8_9FUSO|nr:Trk system potassium transporter TrkA [Propionigenium maris]GLI55082.1 Trk system potassium transport protein TrkA [Propionigenium maris DSM 9537]
MNIVIAGGGDVGIKIAQKLIYEGYNVTLIEREGNLINMLKNKLDAMIIKGDATDVATLQRADILNATLFIAVTSTDTDNLVACSLVRRMCGSTISIASKINEYNQFFSHKEVSPKDFGIDATITPWELTVKKVIELIHNPDIFEVANYAGSMAQMVGVKVGKDFPYSSTPLFEVALKDSMLTRIRLVAIQREGDIIIPRGESRIYPNDKLYFVGKTDVVKEVVKKYFSLNISLDNIIITGGNKKVVKLAKLLAKLKRTVTIIEEDKRRCRELSAHLEDALVINGLATDRNLLDELKMEDSCVVNMSNDDEYNILSSFMAKKYGASKTICMIKHSSIVSVINNLAPIDTVFSPHALTVGETLKLTRKDDLFSVSPFTEIEAETIGINITEELSILGIPLKSIPLPPKTIIGVIIRGEEVIIPTGEDTVMLGDRIVIFLLSSEIYEVKRMFSKR